MSTTTELVKKLPPVITGSIIRHLRQDGGDTGNLLQVSHAWRNAFMKAMCNRIEILQIWREGRFDCKYTVAKNDINALVPINHRLVKQVKLEFELHSVLLGFALESLNCKPFNTFKFPSAYVMDISVIVCPCAQEIDAEKANQNIAEFIAFVKQMCPNIDSKRIYALSLGRDIDSSVLDLKDKLTKDLYSDADVRHKAEYTQPAGPDQSRPFSPDLVGDIESVSDSDADKEDSEPYIKDIKLMKGGIDVIEYNKEKRAYLILLTPYIRCMCCREFCYVKDLPRDRIIKPSDMIGKKFSYKSKSERHLGCSRSDPAASTPAHKDQ